jgi:hypothetical protein
MVSNTENKYGYATVFTLTSIARVAIGAALVCALNDDQQVQYMSTYFDRLSSIVGFRCRRQRKRAQTTEPHSEDRHSTQSICSGIRRLAK